MGMRKEYVWPRPGAQVGFGLGNNPDNDNPVLQVLGCYNPVLAYTTALSAAVSHTSAPISLQLSCAPDWADLAWLMKLLLTRTRHGVQSPHLHTSRRLHRGTVQVMAYQQDSSGGHAYHKTAHQVSVFDFYASLVHPAFVR